MFNPEDALSDQRRFRRISYRESLGLETGAFEQFQGTTAYDLSQGGIRIRSEQFIALGTPIRVKFNLENEDVVVLTGKVVWVQKESGGDYYQLGVDFPDAESNLFPKKRIQEYIEDEM